MKRAMVMILSLLLIVTLIGCSNKESGDGKASSGEAATEESSEVESSGKTEEAAQEAEEAAAEVAKYKDGTYEYQTPPDNERYYTKGTIVIEGGKITSVDWTIYDSNNNDRPFDETYYEVFPDSEYYAQQSRDDWSGSRGYADALIETQDIEEVDAVSAATWTNKKFKQFVRYALIEAINKTN